MLTSHTQGYADVPRKTPPTVPPLQAQSLESLSGRCRCTEAGLAHPLLPQRPRKQAWEVAVPSEVRQEPQTGSQVPHPYWDGAGFSTPLPSGPRSGLLWQQPWG